MAVAASYDATLQYGAQTPFSVQLTFGWEGSMWEYDAQHNSIISAGNGGTKPTQAAFTLFYNQGAERYDVEQTLQPDDQMWIDVGKLIREDVPDKNGKTLPADLTTGSYEFRDLTDKFIGALFEGKVIYEKTYGHVTYGCGQCCAYDSPWLTYNPLDIADGFTAPNGVDATDCNGIVRDVSSKFAGDWTTANPPIATVDTNGVHTGLSVGSTSTTTWGYLIQQGSLKCPIELLTPTGNDNVQLSVSFSNTPIVPLGKPVPITATVDPPSNTVPITLTISTTNGTGSATFGNGSTTKTITTTTVLTIVGVTASSTANNIKLAATVSSAQVAYTTFTVTVAVTGAIPVNFM
jgi:hypothetical protein